jgi:hypothetical protein
LDKNKERLREENRTKLTRELEQLLKGESVRNMPLKSHDVPRNFPRTEN